MRLVIETKSYKNHYSGLDVWKVNSELFFPHWWDASEWIANYIDQYDQLRRASLADEHPFDMEVKRIKAGAFLFNTIIVVKYDTGIDTIFIQMKW